MSEIEEKSAKSSCSQGQTCDHFSFVISFYVSLIGMGRFERPRAFGKYQDRMIQSSNEEVMKEGVKDAEN